MNTSGQLQYDVTKWRYCGRINHVIHIGATEAICDFDGEVDVTYDPEIRTAFWACPDCGTDHEEEL